MKKIGNECYQALNFYSEQNYCSSQKAPQLEAMFGSPQAQPQAAGNCLFPLLLSMGELIKFWDSETILTGQEKNHKIPPSG